MDTIKLSVLEDKKKDILKKIVDMEFNFKLNKSSELLNSKTISLYRHQLQIINSMIGEEDNKIEK